MNKAQRCRYGLMLYNVNDPVIGRSLAAYGEWAQAEMDLLARFVGEGDWVVDVGAYIGTHTLFFSRQVKSAGRVIAVEPQRLVFQTLCANVALNSLTNVHAYLAAAGREPGFIDVPVPDYNKGENFSAVSFRHQAEVSDSGLRERAEVITIDGLELDQCRLIKADVEGMEIEVLEGAVRTIERHRPILYVENNFSEPSAALVRFIRNLGYDIWIHVSPDFNPDNFLGETRNVQWGYFDINMLCSPEGVEVAGADVEPLDDAGEPLHRLQKELAAIAAEP